MIALAVSIARIFGELTTLMLGVFVEMNIAEIHLRVARRWAKNTVISAYK